MRYGLRTPLVIVIASAIVGLAAGSVGLAAIREAHSKTTEPRPEIGTWPDDVDGDGWVSDTGAERIPELVRAVGDSGIVGYVRLADLEGPPPATPEEAVAMSDQVRTIPVYDEDGVTVIDGYTLSSDDDVGPPEEAGGAG